MVGIIFTCCLILFILPSNNVVIGQQNNNNNFLPKSNADLATKLMQLLVEADKGGQQQRNVVFAPGSLLTGMAMLYQGMDDQTRARVGPALNFPSNHNKFLRDFQVCRPRGVIMWP
jgi:serine protease inhibitor